MIGHGSDDDIELGNGQLRARIRRRGAELVGLSHRDVGELLWSGDATYWGATSPLLFPVIGLAGDGHVRIGDDLYPMPHHGFAHTMVHELLQHGPTACRFRLTANKDTHQHFPFQFRLDCGYRLDGPRLEAHVQIFNDDDKPFAASFGFHPGLRLPLAEGISKDSHFLDFGDEKELELQRVVGRRLAPEKTSLPLDHGRLPVDESRLSGGALIARGLRTRAVTLCSSEAMHSVTLGYEGCPDMALWMAPGADFICIEPWHGLPEPADFTGELFERPGAFVLVPGKQRSFAMTIAIAPAGM